MAKINKSDYSYWAKRKSTGYLVRFVQPYYTQSVKERLRGNSVFVAPHIKYGDRKIRAAIRELVSRENTSCTDWCAALEAETRKPSHDST